MVLKDGKPIGVLVNGVRARRLHDAVAPARVPLADARRLGMARARSAALRAGPRALARPQARRGRVRSAAELPAADADPHAIAGEVAVRDLARQPAVDRDARRAALRHRDRRPRQSAHAHRLLRDARLGDRRDPSRRARDVASPRTLAAGRGDGQPDRVRARDDRSRRAAATRCRRSTARSRSRAAIPTARASGGATSAFTRT